MTGTGKPWRLVLGSASPARLATLRSAGLDPEVIVSGVDEDAVHADRVPDLVAELARLKATAVVGRLRAEGVAGPTIVLGGDSLLELDGRPYGKPADHAEAVGRWRRMRGREGVLHTGHQIMIIDGDEVRERNRTASTRVRFADLSDAEIEAYVATGEPLQVAGAFTIDGLGGPFVTSIDGDHHTVVGISLPLLRELLAELGVAWPELW
ncbi:Maf family protein [Microlunatus parietis]|uniref:Nucleoside triphosphate pyrophosphatase n=1 Tax=Microlunatus parietis TaxID=682979 RepID=A0A7Y9IBF2_9ACTN|nr:Maf family protein [Microlunatus parietis]NYE73826.1 septum formation protein [Microlunatus parietis]